MTATYWLGVVFAVLVLLSIFLRMRNSGMKEHYATWWIVIAIGTAVFSVFPRSLTTASAALGVTGPLNLGFFLAGVILLLLSLRFSVDLSQSAEDRRRLAEEIAILRENERRLTERVAELERCQDVDRPSGEGSPRAEP